MNRYDEIRYIQEMGDANIEIFSSFPREFQDQLIELLYHSDFTQIYHEISNASLENTYDDCEKILKMKQSID